MGYLNYKNSELNFGVKQTSLIPFTKNYKGPQYVYDLGIIKQRYHQMHEALHNVDLFYAMKANSHPAVLKTFAEMGAGADVVSGGEIKRALENGFTVQKIIYSGVGKTRAEIREALQLKVGQINVESLPEVLRIIEIAQELKVRAPIALRLNPDVDIKTHPYIATGLKDNKFGMEISVLAELIPILKAHQDVLDFKGLSLHLGSMMTNLAGYQEALQKLVKVFVELKKDFPALSVFDIGGGLGIFYDRQDLAGEKKLLNEYAEITHHELKSLVASGVRLQSEPGRWLVAHAGVLLMQVQYIKPTTHKTFVIVDSGMNHLLRPSLYGALHAVFSLAEKSQTLVADLVGPICESGDFFAKDRMMPVLVQDDFIILADVGAYGFSMANNYNLHELPLEVVLD